MSIQSKLQKSTPRQIDEHIKLSTSIDHKASEQSRSYEHLSTAFGKQCDTITNTQEVVQGISRQQDTLTTAISTQHTDLKKHLSLHTGSQAQSSKDQAALIIDTKIDVKDMSGQISLLMTLQRSMAESV